MPSPPLTRSTAELLAALPILDEPRTAAARVAAVERTIDYRFGTAEAEEVALFAGIKPLVRQFLRAEDLDRARARFAAHDLHVEESPSTFVDPPYPGRVLYVGRDPARVRAALHADVTTDMEQSLGRLLGYPRCCVARFLELRPPRRNVDLHRLARAATKRPWSRLNVCDLAVFHYLSWVPCSFSCAPSLAYANQVAWQLAFRHGQALANPGIEQAVCPPGCAHQRFVARIEQALSAHRLILFEDAQLSLTGRFTGDQSGEKLSIEKVWPTARDRHPHAVLAKDSLELVARVTARLETAHEISIEGQTLLADGVPLLSTADLLLVPFGPISAPSD